MKTPFKIIALAALGCLTSCAGWTYSGELVGDGYVIGVGSDDTVTVTIDQRSGK